MSQVPASNFRRILVVGDASPASENAAWRAGLLAREHRGSLAYRSRPGHTLFTLLLPVQTDEEGERHAD